jgi:hypothetical protein
MADLPSVKLKINDIEVSQDAPVTEALLAKKGSSINALIDDLAALDTSTDARLDALEARTDGQATNTGVIGGVTLTVLTFTTTLTANDSVVLTLAPAKNAGWTFSNFGVGGLGGTFSLEWRRGITVVQGGSSGAFLSIPHTTIVDKPGAGTFTYTLVAGATGGLVNVSGVAVVQRLDG